MQGNRLPFNPPGKKLGQYKFHHEIGRGNYGVVYLASDEQGKKYAIKSIKKEIFKENDGVIGILIKNEKNALLQIRSPHVVRLYEYIESVNQAYMVLELCESGNFETIMICKQFDISIYEAIQYFKQIVKGMQALHEKRIIHRDLKLNNILMKENSTLKISDLGFCHLLSENESQVKLNLGTIGSKAPEIMQNKAYGVQVDMFSAGVMFYQLLCDGAFPFPPISEKQYLEDILKGPQTIEFYCKKIIPQKLKDLIRTMLHYDPDVRLKWSDLFKQEIFSQEVALDTYLGFNSRVDNKQYIEFYASNENKLVSQVSPKFAGYDNQNFGWEISETTNKTKTPDGQKLDISKIKQATISVTDFKKFSEISFNSFNQNQNQELQQLNSEQEEINNLFEKYLEFHRYYQLHRVAYSLTFQTQFQSPRQIIVPNLMLMKKVFMLLQQQIHEIQEENCNQFQSNKLESLKQTEQWKVFCQELQQSKNYVYDLIISEQRTVKKNFQGLPDTKIQQYIQPEWLRESETYFAGENFDNYYQACMERFINYLIQDIYSFGMEKINQKKKQILAIYLIKCLTLTTIPSTDVAYLQNDQLLEDANLLSKIFNENCELFFKLKK